MIVIYTCIVCGYNKLNEKPYDENRLCSFEICRCCGFQFGVDDGDLNLDYETYRNDWIKKGAIWFSPNFKPSNWSLEEQLKNLNNSSTE